VILKHYLQKLISFCALVIAFGAQAAYFDDVDYVRLTSELGLMTPDGTGVAVGQAEADNNSDPDIIAYAPDLGNIEFSGKTIIEESGITGFYSGHATSVGKKFYGDNTSTAPGIGIPPGPAISSYWADDWLAAGFLRAGQNASPIIAPGRITNHSWVGAFVQDAANLEVLRRIDWLVATDESIQVAGFTSKPLLGSAFNVIAVTETKRQTISGSGPVSGDPAYAVSHSRPDLVAPEGSISSATPRISSAAALLIDTAHSDPLLSNGSTTNRNGDVIYNAERSEVVKAALMAGADRVTSNTTGDDITDYRVNVADQTANGLDRRFGAGQLNIYHSYHIVAAGEQDSDQDDRGRGSGQIGVYGFDYDGAFGGQQGSNSEASYFFWVGPDLVELTAALVWNIEIVPGPESRFDQDAKLYDLDLSLYEVLDPGDSGTWILISTSNSASENTENIWDVLLPGKNYALQITPGTGQTAFKWDYGLAWQIKVVADDDNDGIPNHSDNCIAVANGTLIPDAGGNSQFDSDGDGYGNLCDADLDNSGFVNFSDLAAFKAVFGTSVQNADLDGSGFVNFADLALFKSLFGMPPGPSGMTP
jgi:hypothetical protein